MIQLLPVLLIVLAIGCAYWWVKRETQRRYELFDSDSTIEVPKKVTLDEQIRISKKELETVFDAITEAICIIDKKFTIIRVNKSYGPWLATHKNCLENIVTDTLEKRFHLFRLSCFRNISFRGSRCTKVSG